MCAYDVGYAVEVELDFDATDAPSPHLIAFVNLDSHPQCPDDHFFPISPPYRLLFVVLFVVVFWDRTVLPPAIVCYAICQISSFVLVTIILRSDRRLRFYELRLLPRLPVTDGTCG